MPRRMFVDNFCHFRQPKQVTFRHEDAVPIQRVGSSSWGKRQGSATHHSALLLRSQVVFLKWRVTESFSIGSFVQSPRPSPI